VLLLLLLLLPLCLQGGEGPNGDTWCRFADIKVQVGLIVIITCFWCGSARLLAMTVLQSCDVPCIADKFGSHSHLYGTFQALHCLHMNHSTTARRHSGCQDMLLAVNGDTV
jgi:hypothetical protein